MFLIYAEHYTREIQKKKNSSLKDEAFFCIQFMPEVIDDHMEVVVIRVNYDVAYQKKKKPYDVGFLRELVLPDISFPTYWVVCLGLIFAINILKV